MDEILKAVWAANARGAVRLGLPAVSCIYVARCLQAILKERGIESELQPVEVIVAPRIWIEWYDAERYDYIRSSNVSPVTCGKFDGTILQTTEEERKETKRRMGRGFDGHLVVRTGDMLHDACLGIFTRPERNLNVPNYASFKILSNFDKHWFGDTCVAIRLTEDVEYKNANAYTERLILMDDIRRRIANG